MSCIGALPDIQASGDTRGIEIDEVGIDNLRYPTTFLDGELAQAGIASFKVTVRLPADTKGTHMSRMVDLVETHLRTLDPRDLLRACKAGAAALDATEIRVSAALAIAIPVTAPASGRVSEQVHEIRLDAIHRDGATKVGTTVATEITTLCPCSKAVSDYGAHNQRSIVTATVWGTGEGDDAYPVTVNRLALILRRSGSSAVVPLVKRPDERVLTMEAHENPCFAEDVVRNASAALRALGSSHSVSVRNLESIHSHDAVASISWLR
ncbi:MAG TPA: GTP cyclohydrolase I FolE2 [Propionicimonas sp.]